MGNGIKALGSPMGRMETQFFAFCQMRRIDTVRAGDMAKAFKLTAAQERKLLSRLCADGWIVRLKRGVYLVPAILPAGGKWMPGEEMVLARLMNEVNGRYQLCGPNAFSFWGFDDQVPNRIYVYNNRISGERTIGTLSFIFVEVADNRLGATIEAQSLSGVPLVVGTKARTLMDAVYDWKRFNGIPRAYDWMRKAMRQDPRVARQLVDCCVRYGNQGTARRIGHVLASCGVRDVELSPLRLYIRSATVVPLVPNRSREGRIDQAWGVIDNDD